MDTLANNLYIAASEIRILAGLFTYSAFSHRNSLGLSQVSYSVINGIVAHSPYRVARVDQVLRH